MTCWKCPCTCVVCVSHKSAIHMVNKGTEMLHKWTMLSGSYREKANSIGANCIGNSIGIRPTVHM